MGALVIAGINGFAGYYTVHAAHKKGHSIIGIGREDSVSPLIANIVDSYITCDLSDQNEVNKLDISHADVIINLAGYAKVGVNETDRDEYQRVNVSVHTNLAQRMLDTNSSARMISISSGAVYLPNQAMPLTEDSSVHTAESANIYAASKLAMEANLQTFIEKGLDIVIARPFNHAGPGQQPGFLIPDLAHKIIASDGSTPIITGNLLTKRDYTHAEDVAEAYIQLATSHLISSRIYNICSGRSVEGMQIFKMLKSALDKPNLKNEIDQSLMRSQDPLDLYGSYDLLKTDTSWQPTKNINQIIADFTDWLKTS